MSISERTRQAAEAVKGPFQMLDALVSIQDTPDFEESGFFSLKALWATADELTITLAVESEGGSVEFQREEWKLCCHHVRVQAVHPGHVVGVDAFESHPVLLPYTEAHVDLHYRGHSAEPMELIAALYIAHEECCSEWIPMSRFIPTGPRLLERLTSGFGILGRGPRRVMEQYRMVLEEHGLQANVFNETAPKRWTGRVWETESSVRALIFTGFAGEPPMYIVAGSFSASVVN